MADKQIIINGIDVSGCERLITNKTYGYVCNCEEDTHLISSCKNRPNCYYKQLKRKEQECEQEKTLKEMYFTYYKAKHSDIKGEFFKLKADYNSAIQKFMRIEEYCKGCNLKADDTACVVLQIINEGDL